MRTHRMPIGRSRFRRTIFHSMSTCLRRRMSPKPQRRAPQKLSARPPYHRRLRRNPNRRSASRTRMRPCAHRKRINARHEKRAWSLSSTHRLRLPLRRPSRRNRCFPMQRRRCPLIQYRPCSLIQHRPCSLIQHPRYCPPPHHRRQRLPPLPSRSRASNAGRRWSCRQPIHRVRFRRHRR
jgi:hypothetical protein